MRRMQTISHQGLAPPSYPGEACLGLGIAHLHHCTVQGRWRQTDNETKRGDPPAQKSRCCSTRLRLDLSGGVGGGCCPRFHGWAGHCTLAPFSLHRPRRPMARVLAVTAEMREPIAIDAINGLKGGKMTIANERTPHSGALRQSALSFGRPKSSSRDHGLLQECPARPQATGPWKRHDTFHGSGASSYFWAVSLSCP